jgi:hypothetical protein
MVGVLWLEFVQNDVEQCAEDLQSVDCNPDDEGEGGEGKKPSADDEGQPNDECFCVPFFGVLPV